MFLTNSNVCVNLSHIKSEPEATCAVIFKGISVLRGVAQKIGPVNLFIIYSPNQIELKAICDTPSKNFERVGKGKII